MKKKLRKRAWIFTLVFLFLAGVAYADYTLPDGRIVHYEGPNKVRVVKRDGTSYVTQAKDNGKGRLIPTDGTVSEAVGASIPKFNADQRDGMKNTYMTVPIFKDGKLSGFGDIYGEGHTYVDSTPVRKDNESRGNRVDWATSQNREWGGGVVKITSPQQEQDKGGSSNSGSSSGSGGRNDTSSPSNPTPPTPYVLRIAVSGPTSLVAGETYSFTATAFYSNGTSRSITNAANWSNGPSFIPDNQGTFTITARYKGVTGSLTVQAVLPPAATPPAPPKVRLYE
ncbi:hypothetical protein [Effusibacillus consociatus]|uniref:BIG2 domain-containing protein n=1 Tax=Effusibacillus consociatus TaxID=1117041 RepID=A0ABV9PYQ9_9BACL